MNRKKTAVGIGVAAAGVAAAAYAQFGPPSLRRTTARSLPELVATWGGKRTIPGVILRVVESGEVTCEVASGFTTRRRSRPLRPSDRFHTASIGKLFTAVAALRLWERGLLDLDAPVAHLVGHDLMAGLVVVNGVDSGATITARQLLSHTAGLANTDDDLRFGLDILLRPQQRRTPELLISRARRTTAVGTPGQRQEYSSAGYFILGLVLEAVAGLPYHKVIRRELLAPIGMEATMESTHEWVRGIDELHHYIGPYDLWKADPSFEFADGGFVTTAEDLTRFGAALMSGGVFYNPSTLDEMCQKPAAEEWVSEREYVGLGLHVAVDAGRRRLLYHGGFWGTGLLMWPERNLVMAYSLGQANSAYEQFQEAALELA
jgi:D-alanyl-D-alanine carboxypeptidase